jgi:hypothetical protein
MQRLLDDAPEERSTTKSQRAVIITLAGTVTTAILLVVLALGYWAYRFRLLASHEGRLARLMAQKPNVELVTVALQNEHSPLVARPGSSTELERAVAAWGAQRGAEIRAKAARAAQTRVFRSGEVIYFLFFDEAGQLHDFVCTMPRDAPHE